MILDFLAQKETLDIEDHKEKKVIKVILEIQVSMEVKDLKVLQDHKVILVNRALKENKAFLVNLEVMEP